MAEVKYIACFIYFLEGIDRTAIQNVKRSLNGFGDFARPNYVVEV